MTKWVFFLSKQGIRNSNDKAKSNKDCVFQSFNLQPVVRLPLSVLHPLELLELVAAVNLIQIEFHLDKRFLKQISYIFHIEHIE